MPAKSKPRHKFSMTKIGGDGASVPRKRRWPHILAWLALSALILSTAVHLATKPPPMPAYAAVRGDWQPSEAWLYDRDGQLLDSERINFERRRLAWVPLNAISPAVRTTS